MTEGQRERGREREQKQEDMREKRSESETETEREFHSRRQFSFPRAGRVKRRQMLSEGIYSSRILLSVSGQFDHHCTVYLLVLLGGFFFFHQLKTFRNSSRHDKCDLCDEKTQEPSI